MFDSVPIEGEHSKMRALTNASGGLCFLVESMEHGIGLFEREAVLSLRHRAVGPPLPAAKGRPVAELVAARPYCKQPPFLVPPRAELILAGRPTSPPSLSAASIRALQTELQQLLAEPEPGFQLLAEDLSFWMVVYTGAPGSPYEGRSFLLYLDLEAHPAAPEVRFLTPVYHLNVNADGRVCLDQLSAWKPESGSIRPLLREIGALMIAPNASSPLDSSKANLFLSNKAAYLATAREHALRDGKKDPKEFAANQSSSCSIN